MSIEHSSMQKCQGGSQREPGGHATRAAPNPLGTGLGMLAKIRHAYENTARTVGGSDAMPSQSALTTSKASGQEDGQQTNGSCTRGDPKGDVSAQADLIH
jgi:hypothetical protein